jgi:transposase
MRKYDDEFKKEAIRKFLDGQSIASISRETGVSEGLLHKWKNKIIQKGDGEVDREKLEMRKRILELEMENEILKKAALIFSRSP